MLRVEDARDMRLRVPTGWRAEFQKRRLDIENNTLPLAVIAEDRDGAVWLLHDEKAWLSHARQLDNLRHLVRVKSTHLAGLRPADGVVIQTLLDTLDNDDDVLSGGETPARKLFLHVVAHGLSIGASDIHFIPTPDFMRVSFRVNGIIQDEQVHSMEAAKRAIEAGAHLSGDRTGPSDENKIEDLSIRNYEFETSAGLIKATLRIGKSGSEHGSHTVIRLFALKKPPTLAELGLSSYTAQALTSAMQASQGVIIVVGPTGHGKSTTLNAVYDLVDDSRMVQLICDPIESDFSHKKNFVLKSVDKGKSRDGSDSESDLTYKNLIKTALRQDPDILGIAEMRDAETARFVFEAALTAHLMATTYHADNPFQALIRLLKEGLSPIVVAETVQCITSQRLVPLMCPLCAFEVEYPSIEFRMRNPKGCTECSSGVIGRVLVDEALVFSPKIRELVTEGASMVDIRKAAIDGGYRSMQEAAREKIAHHQVCPLDAQMIVGDLYDAALTTMLYERRMEAQR